MIVEEQSVAIAVKQVKQRWNSVTRCCVEHVFEALYVHVYFHCMCLTWGVY